jgi:elongation factor G
MIASMAIKEAAKKCNPIILEPIMKVVVSTPDTCIGDVIGDLNKRRGRIQSQDQKGPTIEVDSEVPLSEMFGYSTDVRSISSGRASFTMEPSHFEQVPKAIQEKISKKT